MSANDSHYNPCLIGRKQWLAPLGDALAQGFDRFFRDPTGDCPCCMAVRVLITVAGALAVGIGIGALL